MAPRAFPERDYSHRTLVDKLGVANDARVCILGVDDAGFRQQLESRTTDVSSRARKNCALIFLAADSTAELSRLRRLREDIVQAGAIWVVSRKGKAATLRDTDVIAAARRAGLVDNKVVAFSQTHTALRLVIPRAQRTPDTKRGTKGAD
ncbi:MAG: DUF3052 family protein [Candidatus Eremiobacteraeota bacterium]|nr:DUF3052 family protein [Candidatus Eremiobacteraeota bacterium]